MDLTSLKPKQLGISDAAKKKKKRNIIKELERIQFTSSKYGRWTFTTKHTVNRIKTFQIKFRVVYFLLESLVKDIAL